MSQSPLEGESGSERELRTRRARRGLLAIALGFYLLLLLLCAIVFIAVLVVAR